MQFTKEITNDNKFRTFEAANKIKNTLSNETRLNNYVFKIYKAKPQGRIYIIKAFNKDNLEFIGYANKLAE